MSIDRFGSRRTSTPGRGFLNRYIIYRDGEGNFIFRNKRLCKVQDPEKNDDAATKIYVDSLTSVIEDRMQTYAEKASYQRLGEFEATLRTHMQTSLDSQYEALMAYLTKYALKRDDEQNILIENVRLKVTLPPIHDQDVVNKKFVVDFVTSQTPSIDSDGNVAFHNRRLREVLEPVSDNDAANKLFVRKFVAKKQSEIHSFVNTTFASMPKEIAEVLDNNLKPMVDRQVSLDKHLTSTMNNVDILKSQVSVINNVLEQLRGQLVITLQTKPLKGTSLRYMLTSGLEYYKIPVDGDVIGVSFISSPQPHTRSDTMFAINGILVDSYPAPVREGDRITFTAPATRARDGHILSIELQISYKLKLAV